MFTTDDQVLKSLSISLKYAAIFVPLNMIIALVLAMLISQPVRVRSFSARFSTSRLSSPASPYPSSSDGC